MSVWRWIWHLFIFFLLSVINFGARTCVCTTGSLGMGFFSVFSPCRSIFFFLVFIAAYPSQLVTSSHAAHQRPWPASCALATAPALSSYVQCGATINDLIFFSFFFSTDFRARKRFAMSSPKSTIKPASTKWSPRIWRRPSPRKLWHLSKTWKKNVKR